MNIANCLSFSQNAAQFGLALLIQSSLILLLGLLLGALLRRRGPQAQSLAYRATLAAVALAALASSAFAPYAQPIWRISFPAAAAVSTQVPTPIEADAPIHLPVVPPDSEALPPMPANAVAIAPSAQAATLPAASLSPPLGNQWYIAAVAVWGAGTASLLFWLFAGQIHLLFIRRQSSRITTGTAIDIIHGFCPERAKNSLILLASPQARSPFLAEVWHPAIFLPASFESDFTEDELRMVLAHEVAHWQSRDNAWLLLAHLICAALWWQPFLWLLAGRLVQSSEEACDMSTLDMGCSPVNYANCLLTLAEQFAPSHLERSLGAGIAPFRSHIGNRIQNILRKKEYAMPSISSRVRAIAAICAGAVALCTTIFISAVAAPSKMVPPAKSTISSPLPSDINNASNAKFLAGLTPVQGPGIIVTLNDSPKASTKASLAAKLPYLIHDTDINQVINELRAVGAEAISVNGQRLVATSPIRCAGPTLLVNRVPQPQPYIIKAIGNAQAMTHALNLPGGVTSELQRLDSAMIHITTKPGIILPAYEGATIDKYAKRYEKPAKAASPSAIPKRSNAVIDSTLNQQQKTLLHQRNFLHQNLKYPQGQLGVAQKELKSHPALKAPEPPANNPAEKTAASMVAKRDYIKAVHEHNNELVAHWNDVAQVKKWASKVAGIQTRLDVTNAIIRLNKSKIWEQERQGIAPTQAR